MLTILLILFPLALSLIIFFTKEKRAARAGALAGALVELGIAVTAFIRFRYVCRCELLASADWFSEMGISLKFGMDGIGLLLVLLTTVLTPVILFSASREKGERPPAFYALVLLMESALVGVFTSFDGLIFYVFWELALIPAWFICALWGGDDRIRITFKFFLYTFTGSLLMLAALVWVYVRTPAPHSFDFQWMYAAALSPREQAWVFAAFFVAFAVKIPVFPFHTWQPDTYATAPPSGSMLLAGIMLKMGVFGMIRWMLPICPDAVRLFTPWAMGLAVTGIVYGSVIAIRQDDLKRLIAWSSIAHVGLITAGVFALNIQALQGSVIQMVSHGINITGLFLAVMFIEHRTGTRSIAQLGGIARQAPRLAFLFMLMVLGSIALPLTNGFVGEFLLLIGLWEYSTVAAAVAGLTVIFSAVYMLWMYQRTMLGDAVPATENFADLSWREASLFIPLAVLVLWIGVAPGMFLDISVQDAVQVLNYLK
ncbi:MAG TPA: NADH-quinone oxidoreductase subunit M [Bacteroidales bacterium]|nr:NADH-quinone oxidoreductase subunit M [Bacteroidales bacterium]